MAKSTPLIARGHTRPVVQLQFSPLEPDGSSFLLVSACKDGTPMLRDGAKGDWLGSFIGHKGAVWSIKLSANTTRAITGSADFSAKIWDAQDGTCLLTLPHEHIVRAVDLSPDGNKAVTGGQEKRLRVWDVKALLARGGAQQPRNKDAAEFSEVAGKPAHEGNIRSVIWDQQNGQLISAGEDKKIKFWSIEERRPIDVVEVDHPVVSMERCHDAEGTIAITYGNKVDFIDPRSRNTYISHTLPYPPSTACLHPFSKDRFVTGSISDGWVRVHDAQTGEEKEMYKGHHGPVHAIAYSPDGELYASGSEDGTIRLWQTTPKTYGLWKYDPNGAT